MFHGTLSLPILVVYKRERDKEVIKSKFLVLKVSYLLLKLMAKMVVV